MIGAVLLAAAVASSGSAWRGDDAADRSPREIVCSLTGDCGGAPGGARMRLPREASFNLGGIADESLERQFAKVRAARLRIAASGQR